MPFLFRFPAPAAVVLLAVALLAVPAHAQRLGARTVSAEAMVAQLSPGSPEEEMQALAAAADAHPLGSLENPIRVGGPEGERAYLSRLRCSGGSTPQIGGRGDGGGTGEEGGGEVTTAPQLVVHRDKELMAQAAAARLITRIVDAQASRGSASVVLTGGRNGNGLLAALSAAPARDAIDWSRLDLWWGDERFLPEGDPERNVTQAREVLLDSVPLDPKRVHAMPASDGPYGTDVDAAAAAYAEELAAAAGPENHGPVPTFDVLMLGVGPDTHVASLFPELPAVRETDRTVVGVHGAPKPPPTRVTLTLPAIRAAREVWLLAAGEDKAQAAAIALSGAGEIQAPAAGAYGRSRTLWLLDGAAASQLPRSLYPPASA